MGITKTKIKKIEKEMNVIREKENEFRVRDFSSNDPAVVARADLLLRKLFARTDEDMERIDREYKERHGEL